jgi:hypothetical protein
MGARTDTTSKYGTKYDNTDDQYTINAKSMAIDRLKEYDSSFKSSSSYVTNSGTKVYNPDNATWAEALSLRTNPMTETPVFKMIIANGSGYSYVVAPPYSDLSDNEAGDMILTEMDEYDSSNSLVGKFTRDATSGDWNKTEYGVKNYDSSLVVGNSYTIKVTVYNSNSTALQIDPAKLDIGTAINDNARQNDYYDEYGNFTKTNATTVTTTSKETTVSGHSYAHFEYTVTVPETANDYFRMSCLINKEHLGYMPDGTFNDKIDDDKFSINDWGYNQYSVAHGDLTPSAIKLIDKNGNEVAQDMMVPGEDYKVEWQYKYTGPDRDQAYNLYFSGDVKRYLPQGTSDTKHYDWSVNKKLKNGDVVTFDSDYITFEIPKVEVTSKVNTNGNVGATTDDLYWDNKYFLNNDTSNDTASKIWQGNWDIKISNLSVYPINDRPLKDEYLTVGVKYDATLTAPSGLQGTGLEFDTNDTITIPTTSGGTQNLIAHTHLKEGTNKDVTQVIQIPVTAITSGSTAEAITVWLNSDKRKYEDDLASQDNNHATTTMKVLPPNNPNNFNTNGNSYGCPIDSSNNNSWDVTHQTLDFSGSRKDYTNFQTGKSYKFFYYPTEDTSSYDSETLDYNESYTIDYVKFKSKFTTDKDYGEDGWVNLMDSSQKDYAKIKAGYGYELDIQATYKNDVFGRQPKQTWTGVWNCVQGAYA